MFSQDVGIPVPELMKELCRAFDVREHQCDRSAGEASHAGMLRGLVTWRLLSVTTELITAEAPETSVQDQQFQSESQTRRSRRPPHLDAGSCNGCDFEINATTNAVHDIQRFGIDLVASPRHADVLLVTGTMTRNLEIAARMTYEAMPDPRLVVAVGACAPSGARFTPGYASGTGAASMLPVDVFIPGCPPRPEAIIEGLLLAVGRLAPRST